MKKYIVKRLMELFNPSQFQELDVYGVLSALQNQAVLKMWLYEVLSQIKQLNLQIDQGLLSGKTYDISDLSAKRRALQGVLESALSIHREVRRDTSHNQVTKADFDFEGLTGIVHKP